MGHLCHIGYIFETNSQVVYTVYTCVMKYASKMGPMKTPNHWLWYIVFNGSSKKYIDNERNGGS